MSQSIKALTTPTKSNRLGLKHIYYDPTRESYRVDVRIAGVRRTGSFKTLTSAIEYRDTLYEKN